MKANTESIRKPEWLKKKFSSDSSAAFTGGVLEALGLNTVCNEALCPNRAECYARHTATFMILGVHCTRDCAFCNVTHGVPLVPDSDEPARIGKAAARLDLRYAVITSVTRDDLPDGGARHFADTVAAIRQQQPSAAIETLVPDFQGDSDALNTVASSRPDVISHNIETVEELYGGVRPGADYRRSLGIIAEISASEKNIHSKSGFMVGFGETEAQVLRLMDDLRSAGCEFLTIGQYLAPSRRHRPVSEYIEPERFDYYAEAARGKGFGFVASAPFVRSSYNAGEALGIAH